MSDTTEPKSDFETLAQLVNTSFPDLYCLRCGNEQFFVTDDPATANLREVRLLLGMPTTSDDGLGPVVTLACRRCGFVEQHLTDLLQKAQKPLPQALKPLPKA
jgi:hypothetical protein